MLALAVGLTALLFVLPAGTGGGEQVVRPLVGLHLPLGALLGLLAVRLVATLASYAAGAPGGIFAPILGLATVAGLAFAAGSRSAGADLALKSVGWPPRRWRRCSPLRSVRPWSGSCWWPS